MELKVFVRDIQTDTGAWIYPGSVVIEVPENYDDDIIADALYNTLSAQYGVTIDSMCWDIESNKPTAIVCNFLHYKIKGKVVINLWGGGKGVIDMTPFNVDDIDDIPNHINDGGFGCESISIAEVDIYEEYEYGASKFVESKYISVYEEVSDELIALINN